MSKILETSELLILNYILYCDVNMRSWGQIRKENYGLTVMCLQVRVEKGWEWVA